LILQRRAEEGGVVSEEGSDAGPALEFLVNSLKGVACAYAALVGDREREEKEALGVILLHPGGKFGSGLGVGGDEMIEAGLSRGEIGAIEDGAYIGSQAASPFETGNVSLGVLLEVELATLPGNRGEDGGKGCGEALDGHR
jgi:hypothetical protein